LAAQGWAVVVNYARNRAAADEVVACIAQAGGQALAVQADVSLEPDVLRLFERTDAWCTHLGRPLKGLVNNAGVVDVACRVDAMSLERLERMFRVNVVSQFLVAREAVKRMSTQYGKPGGAIINLSSVAASIGAPGWYVDYAASKGAIDTFTKGLAKELAMEGVRVNGIRPGIIDTDIHASGGAPDRAHQSAALIPMQRPGTADEIAAAVVWLMSDAAAYTTGAILDVSGGR
jgi:NAD(P)-dependent dehydrogenase (short-subunit alcohol dehydrogenase family)